MTIGPPDATLEDFDALCGQYRVSGLPVVGPPDDRLLGICTNRDLRFIPPVAEWASTKVSEVMTTELFTAPPRTSPPPSRPPRCCGGTSASGSRWSTTRAA